jgi:polysaccharide export outer membrane protein
MWQMKKARSALIGLSLYVLLSGMSQADEAPPPRESYGVNAGDILRVSVWKEEDLQRELLVRPDGHFSFPLAGDVAAEGRSVEQIRRDLTDRLAKYVPNLVVTVEALKIEGNKVFVLGKVNRPGEFVMNANVDVMQAISMAGGTTPFASLNDIKVLRRSNGQQIAIPFNYDSVQSGKKLDQNILLRAGDTVVVP